MKSLIPLFLALMTACTTGQYRIHGIYTVEDGTPVWLIDQNAKDTLAETAVQDGRFSFSGRVQEPFFAYVGNGKQRVHFILEPGTATVDIDERTASGMPMEDAYTAFHRRFYGFKREQKAEKAALADSMVRANRDNLVGAVALEDLAHVDADRFLSLYELLPDDLQAFYLVKSARIMWAAAAISCWTTGPPGAAPARPRCLISRRLGKRSTATGSTW